MWVGRQCRIILRAGLFALIPARQQKSNVSVRHVHDYLTLAQCHGGTHQGKEVPGMTRWSEKSKASLLKLHSKMDG